MALEKKQKGIGSLINVQVCFKEFYIAIHSMMLPDSTQIVLEEVPGSFHDYTRLQSKKSLMYHIHLLEWMAWVLVPNGYGKSHVFFFKICPTLFMHEPSK